MSHECPPNLPAGMCAQLGGDHPTATPTPSGLPAGLFEQLEGRPVADTNLPAGMREQLTGQAAPDANLPTGLAEQLAGQPPDETDFARRVREIEEREVAGRTRRFPDFDPTAVPVNPIGETLIGTPARVIPQTLSAASEALSQIAATGIGTPVGDIGRAVGSEPITLGSETALGQLVRGRDPRDVGALLQEELGRKSGLQQFGTQAVFDPLNVVPGLGVAGDLPLVGNVARGGQRFGDFAPRSLLTERPANLQPFVGRPSSQIAPPPSVTRPSAPISVPEGAPLPTQTQPVAAPGLPTEVAARPLPEAGVRPPPEIRPVTTPETSGTLVEQTTSRLETAQANFDTVITPPEGQLVVPGGGKAGRSRRREARVTLELAQKDAEDATRAVDVPAVDIASAVGDADRHVEWFRAFLNDPERIIDWEATIQHRREVLAGRAGDVKQVTERLIEEGYSSEEAVRLARQSLSGQLPTTVTGIEQVVTPAIRNSLFDAVRVTLADEPFEMISTHTALTNALLGRAIPRTPGREGGSAFSRLVRVFGTDIAEGISQGKTLQQLLTLSAKRTARRPRTLPIRDFPSTQTFGGTTTERLVPEAAPLGQPQVPLRPEPPIPPGQVLPPDLRTPAQRELELQTFREQIGQAQPPTGPSIRTDIPEEAALRQPAQPLLPEPPPGPFRGLPPDRRTVAEKQLDLQTFKELTGEAQPPTGPTPGLGTAIGDIPPEGTISQAFFIPRTTGERMVDWAKGIGLTAVDIGNLIRANKASVDFSYLRQQALLIPGNIRAFIESFGDALRAAWSDTYAKTVDDRIRSASLRTYYGEGPDFLRALDGPVAKAWQRAEEFQVIDPLGRPVQRFAAKLPWLRISNRAFVTGINSMNWSIYEGQMRMLLRIQDQQAAGLIKGPLMGEQQIRQSMNKFAGMLADMSGRGPLGPLKELSPVLNASMFSLRNTIGRLIAPRHLVSSDKYVRQAAWKNFFTAIAAYSGILFAAEQMGLWQVETDHRSSDFMKIRVGDRLRVDIWGGFQQYAVLYGRLLPVVGGIKSTKTGAVSDFDPVSGIARFGRNKASPLLSETLSQWTDKDFIGRDVDRRDFKRYAKELAPFAVSDILEATEAEGLMGLFAGVPSAVAGFGIYGAPPTTNDIAEELFGKAFDDIPISTDQGIAARKLVRRVLNDRLTEDERRRVAEQKADTTQDGIEREDRRIREFNR